MHVCDQPAFELGATGGKMPVSKASCLGCCGTYEVVGDILVEARGLIQCHISMKSSNKVGLEEVAGSSVLGCKGAAENTW